MKARIGAVFLASATIALLALPAVASAKPGYYVTKPSRLVIFQTQGTNGYRVMFVSFAPKAAILLATKGHSSVSYVVRPRLRGDRIEARFGKRGLVAVRMQPSKSQQQQQGVPDHCNGRDSINQTGHFVGTIRFQGEQSFTKVDTTHAFGQEIQTFRSVCKRVHEGKQEPAAAVPDYLSLDATRKLPHGETSFTAFKSSQSSGSGSSLTGDGAQYSATLTERRGRLSIYRSVSTSAKTDTFAVSPLGSEPTTANVSPPAPFTGSATFERSGGEDPRWSGDLAVDFPGHGPAQLTGSAYSAQLCRDSSCACNRRHPCLGVFEIQSVSRDGRARARLKN